ncbi:hypothetical protein L3X38_041042 [Prunus dulcis]|uniref:Uncharacterized protein n=1 Tax=Prunus dulcis TaxID=3755 RepID=A0AAD4UTL5_PRUDU|nr:hypothetical protein L3X38_041042 [Prunus dulcis]
MHVKFVKVDKEETARSAFKYSSRISDEEILCPWFYVFCKQKPFDGLPCNKELVNDVWTICYDYYDKSLYDWVRRVMGDKGSSYTKSSKQPINNVRDYLHPYWIETISQLINVVTCIHGDGFFHGSLKKKKNYVMGEKSLKIINFDGSLEGIDVTYQDKSKNDDFVDIKSMLGHCLSRYSHPKLHRRRKRCLKKEKENVMGKKGLKIIKFGGLLEGIDVTYQEKSKNDDFLDIKSMLGHLFESLLAPKTLSSKKKTLNFGLKKEWIEEYRFLKFFGLYSYLELFEVCFQIDWASILEESRA